MKAIKSITNKYGQVDIFPDGGISYRGWVRYETFLDELNNPMGSATIKTNPNTRGELEKHMSVPESSDLAAKLYLRYLDSMSRVNPYAREYIPELDDPENGDERIHI